MSIPEENIVPYSRVHTMSAGESPEKGGVGVGMGGRNWKTCKTHKSDAASVLVDNFTLECLDKTGERERQVLPAQSQRNVQDGGGGNRVTDTTAPPCSWGIII